MGQQQRRLLRRTGGKAPTATANAYDDDDDNDADRSEGTIIDNDDEAECCIALSSLIENNEKRKAALRFEREKRRKREGKFKGDDGDDDESLEDASEKPSDYDERAFYGLREAKRMRKQSKLVFHPSPFGRKFPSSGEETGADPAMVAGNIERAETKTAILTHRLARSIVDGDRVGLEVQAPTRFVVKRSTQSWLNLSSLSQVKKLTGARSNSVETCCPNANACAEFNDFLDDIDDLGIEAIVGIDHKRRDFHDDLLKRSTCGTRLTRAPLSSKRSVAWKESTFVSLQQHPGRREPKHLAWDTEGLLLAVAYSDQTVAIYDWDMFLAADMKSRSEQQRLDSPACAADELAHYGAPPILVFKVPFPPASIVWNPYHADQVAVSFCRNSHVHVYRVDKISLWSQTNEGSRMSCPPKQTFDDYYTPYTSQSATTVLFLDTTTLLACIGKAVCCWSMAPMCSQPHRLLWTLQNPSVITCAACFGPRMVVLGSEKGHLMLVDWKNAKRKRAFSSFQSTPTLLNEWKPHRRNYDSADDRQQTMGICRIFVEGDGPAVPLPGRFGWGCHRIFWVTDCGWLLSTVIESPKEIEDSRLWHISPKVVVKKSNGESVSLVKPAWSRPKDPPLAASPAASATICWTSVPQMTRILSHHDKFVLDSSPSVLYSDEKALMWVDDPHHLAEEGGNVIQRIALPSEWAGLPKAIAVHPSQEWIVVIVSGGGCGESQLKVLASR